MAEEFVPSPEYTARAERLQAALELKQPDRIPIVLWFGLFLADYAGITRQELYENPEKAHEILEEVAMKYQPDAYSGVRLNPEPSKILGDRMTKWPGHGLGPQGSFQFDEHEFMKAEDYDAFLNDPSDFAIRTYLPRAFEELEGLAMLPSLGMSLFGYYSIDNTTALLAEPVVEALEALTKAAKATMKFNQQMATSTQKMADLGFPGSSFRAGALLEAPFDFMSDTLRGMRGIFLDMMRIPDKLLEAEQRVLKMQVEYAIAFSQATGLKGAFIPLHRGSDGFMSLAQFEKFYWPQLKDMLCQLVDAGIRPFVFYEGVWNQRLEYLADLPRGKTIGEFQDSDIFRVKEIVGDTMCIFGGMPIPLLKNGSPEEIRARAKEVCERAGKDGGFIMAPSVMELEGIKPENIHVWVDATKEFGVY